MPSLDTIFLPRYFCRFFVLLFVSVFDMQMAHADMQVGTLVISDIDIRATAPGMSATAGYLTIANHGMKADRLIAVKADFAERSMIHEMTNVDGIAKMRHLMGGVEVPAHGNVALEPGGLHLMFMGLKDTLAVGQTLSVTLVFEQAGAQKQHAMVKKPADIGGMSTDPKTKKKHSH
ncbi:copper chaperone PCu(A)C [Candidatus Puniceispirillum sp.]|uniref:copper chaperone PCu(A)C n=1 Tax=Candidatus Puniceispirillum sp. TaxID=2026719 RepID=UPI003F69DB30